MLILAHSVAEQKGGNPENQIQERNRLLRRKGDGKTSLAEGYLGRHVIESVAHDHNDIHAMNQAAFQI